MLDFCETRKNRIVVFKLAEIVKRSRILLIVLTNALVNERGKTGVGVAEPTAVSNTVCNISETLGI